MPATALYADRYRPASLTSSGVMIGDPAQFGRPFIDGGNYWCHLDSGGRSWAIIMCDAAGNYLYDAAGLRKRDPQAHAKARAAFLLVERQMHEELGLRYTPTLSTWPAQHQMYGAEPPIAIVPWMPRPHVTAYPCDVPGADYIAFDEDGGDGAGDGADPCAPDYSSLLPIATGIRNIRALTDADRRLCHRAVISIGPWGVTVNTWLRIGYLHHQGGPVKGGDPALEVAKTVLDIALAIIGCCTGTVGLIQYSVSDLVSTWWAYATADQAQAQASWAKLRAAAGRGGDASKEGYSGEVKGSPLLLHPATAYAAQRLLDRYAVPHIAQVDRSTMLRHATAAGLSAAAILALAALVL